MIPFKMGPVFIAGSILLFCFGVLDTVAQDQPNREIFFSTEEDFVTSGSIPDDGNPIISDGDLLNSAGSVYMRNKDLLAAFLMEYDLGLDAAEIVDVEKRFVIFSTELNHPRKQFSAGDLIATNGAVIPNAVLLSQFDISSDVDLGLDALYFQGDPDAFIKVLEIVKEQLPDVWRENPLRIFELLKEYNLDILFSVEGTYSPSEKIRILDGDVLSMRNGTIVIRQEDILVAPYPAGIPTRGVDFGVDALTLYAEDYQKAAQFIFSTEINGALSAFTDGDALLKGNGIVFSHSILIRSFEPYVKDLGLDSLSIPDDRVNELVNWMEY